MDQNQRELRHTATEAFIESLEQLERRLQATETEAPSCDRAPHPDLQHIDANAFAEAVADIEQFIRAQQQP